MTEEEKVSISEAIARQLMSGSEVDKKLTEKLIKGLCEEYNQVRERSFLSEGEGSVDRVQ